MHRQQLAVILAFSAFSMNTICLVSPDVGSNDIRSGRDVDDSDNAHSGAKLSVLSDITGMQGVWWPGSHVISSWWSLLAAGLSSLAIGATVLPATRRLDNVEDRVFRGVQAEPYSWPWIAKLKVRRVFL